MPDSIRRILRLQERLPDETTVWLTARGQEASFNCNICKKTLFKHKHRVVALLDGEGALTLNPSPISIQCPVCGTIYHVSII